MWCRLVGSASLFSATLLVLVVGFLFHSLFVDSRRSVHWRRDGEEVRIRLPRAGKHHLFISHVWRTGQDQAKSIALLLTQLLPSMKVYLDVDEALKRVRPDGLTEEVRRLLGMGLKGLRAIRATGCTLDTPFQSTSHFQSTHPIQVGQPSRRTPNEPSHERRPRVDCARWSAWQGAWMTKNVIGSTVLLVILTEGYFKSRNCLKELGTASTHALCSL